MSYQQVTRARDEGPGTITAFVGAVRRHPKLSSFLVLWALMALSFVYAPAPVVVTAEMQQKFEATLQRVPVNKIRAARIAFEDEEFEMSQAKVWFWRFRPEYSAQVAALQPQYDAAKAKLDSLLAERDEIMKEARQVVGIWSEYGVEEAREKFWDNMNRGKEAAKRMTWWDAMFAAFGTMGRDEGLLSFIIRVAIQFVMNMTVGLGLMLVAFVFSLISLISSFGPNPLSGLLFFLVVGGGAIAVVTGIISLLFGTVGGAVYVVAKQATNARLRDQQRAQQQYLHRAQYGGRAHYE